MGYTLDYFVAKLKCPLCEAISNEDESTNMQTYVRSQPDLAYLGVGHSLKIYPETMRDFGYLTIQLPQPHEEIHILHTWECPTCSAPFNWAEIVIAQDKIKEIKTVRLTRESFMKSHFISNECVSVVADLTGKSFSDLQGLDWVAILKGNL